MLDILIYHSSRWLDLIWIQLYDSLWLLKYDWVWLLLDQRMLLFGCCEFLGLLIQFFLARQVFASYPWMLSDLIETESKSWVLLKHSIEKVFKFIWHLVTCWPIITRPVCAKLLIFNIVNDFHATCRKIFHSASI